MASRLCTNSEFICITSRLVDLQLQERVSATSLIVPLVSHCTRVDLFRKERHIFWSALSWNVNNTLVCFSMFLWRLPSRVIYCFPSAGVSRAIFFFLERRQARTSRRVHSLVWIGIRGQIVEIGPAARRASYSSDSKSTQIALLLFYHTHIWSTDQGVSVTAKRIRGLDKPMMQRSICSISGSWI